MTKIKKPLILLIIIIFFNSCFLYEKKVMQEEREKFYYDYLDLPKQVGVVNDYENILSKKQENVLDSIISQFHQKTSNEIVIISIDSINNFKDLQEFTSYIDNYWEVGNKKENGLIITISKELRSIWIKTDMNTKNKLTEEFLKKIIDEQMIPEFKNDKYYEGIKTGLLHCIEEWE